MVHAARATARRSSASVTQRRSDRLRRQCASLEDARWITLETSRKTSEVVGRDGEVADERVDAASLVHRITELDDECPHLRERRGRLALRARDLRTGRAH